MRTGRRTFQAATATSGCTETSSLPPKPPPQPEGRMRTFSGGMPSTRAVSSRSM